MDKIRVLIFPAGAENALEIYDAIRYNVNIEAFGVSGKADHAQFVYDEEHYFESEDYYIDNPDFRDKFCNLLQRLSIDVLIPTHDTIALYFALNARYFPVKILTSDLKTAQVCREKKKMYGLFEDCSFCPKIYHNIEDIIGSSLLFAKPNIGEGAKGAGIIRSLNDLQFYLDGYKKEYVIMEYLPGDEFTVDCFTDSKGNLRYCGIRTRERIQMGIAFRSETVVLPEEVSQIAQIINQRLNFFGGWFFQVKKDKNNKYKLLEISCRMAGTMTLHRHKGINFALLGIFEIMGVATEYLELPGTLKLDRSLRTKFQWDHSYKKIYIDYDDTVTNGEGVNEEVLQFLYQCRKNEKKVILLTRHQGNLKDDMDKRCIHSGLFDEIIHISIEENKEDFINPIEAIFIDNSFAERKKVAEFFHIPVLDVDAVDMLLN